MAPCEILACRKESLEAFLDREREKLEFRDPGTISPSSLEAMMELAFVEGWIERDKLSESQQ